MERHMGLAALACVLALGAPPPANLHPAEEDAGPTLEQETLGHEFVSLMQHSLVPTSSGRISMRTKLMLRQSTSLLDDPVLRKRLNDLLHRHGQELSPDRSLNVTVIEEALKGPFKNETAKILEEEATRKQQEELDPHSKSDRARSEAKDLKHLEKEEKKMMKESAAQDRKADLEERKHHGSEKSRRRKEEQEMLKDEYEKNRRKQRDESLTERGKEDRTTKAEARRIKKEEEANRRHADDERKRLAKEEDRRLRDELYTKRKEELLQQIAAEKAASATAERAFQQAASERQHWQDVAEEAKKLADKELKIEAEAMESMEKAVSEEKKWKELADEAAKKATDDEALVGRQQDLEEQQRRQQQQMEAEAEARQKAEAEARAKAEAEAEARAKAEAEARAKAEAEARQAAEAEAKQKEEQRRAKEFARRIQERQEAEAEEARRKAEAEAEAAAEAARKQALVEEAEAEARQKAEEEARQKAAEEARQAAAEEDARQKAEEEARQKAEEEARQKAAEDARQAAAEEAEEEARQQVEKEARQKAAEEKEARQKLSSEAQMEAVREEAVARTEVSRRMKDRFEVTSIVNSWEQARVCVRPDDLSRVLEESEETVLRQGLPEWTEPEAPEVDDVTLAFLVQASWEEQLPVMRRVFDRLYSTKDLFLYTVDRERLDAHKVMDALPQPLPDNVVVKPSAHSAYYVWPRVEIVLDGLRTMLLHEKRWDFAIHLSESDYPVHSINWIRKSFAMQRKTNFIQVMPRCSYDGEQRQGLDLTKDEWYWWTQDDALASCGSEIDVTPVDGVKFPLNNFEQRGFRFAHGAEWMAITRELVKYALNPKLLPYRKLVGMHVGADEIFWQTLVLNIPKFRQKISRQGWYIRWGHGKTDHSPDTLDQSYEEDIMSNRRDYFFIRKVNGEDSRALLDDIDRKIDEGDDEAPGPLTNKDEVNEVVPCSSVITANPDEPFSSFYTDPESWSAPPPPPAETQVWKGTKSRKQLLESYKRYMQNQ